MNIETMIGAATAIAVGISVYQQKRAEIRREKAEQEHKEAERQAAEERREVKRDIEANTAATRDVQHKVNGWLTEILKSVAEDKRRIAGMTTAAIDIAAAEVAEKRLRDHIEEQARVAREAALAKERAQRSQDQTS